MCRQDPDPECIFKVFRLTGIQQLSVYNYSNYVF